MNKDRIKHSILEKIWGVEMKDIVIKQINPEVQALISVRHFHVIDAKNPVQPLGSVHYNLKKDKVSHSQFYVPIMRKTFRRYTLRMFFKNIRDGKFSL